LRRRRRTATELAPALVSFAATVVTLVSVSLSVPGSAAAQQVENGSVADGAALLDRFLDEVTTLAARFTQELWTADNRLLETASGTFMLSRPNKFRWVYDEPYEQLIVADEKNLWIYDVELEQVTVTAMDRTSASSPAMLLSGDRAVREGFEVVDTFRLEGLDWVRLAPTLAGTDFTSVLIAFDDVTPRRLELVDGLNQVTRIEFEDVVVNPELEKDAFEFDVPRGVDVIGTPG
jgi:outer membrane lipoprotein carrier protein